MATKRKPITFSELDNLQPKGKSAILRSAEEVKAEGRGEIEVEEISFDTPSPTPSRSSKSQRPAAEPERSPARSETSKAALRATYAKTSYRMHPDAFDAINDAKRILSRQHGLKTSFEEIAEKAILIAFNALIEQGEDSDLVRALREDQ